MKKIGIVTLVLVLLLGLGTVAAYARTKKVDLNVSPLSGIHDPEGDVVGWVIVNKNAAGKIIVEVHLNTGERKTLFYVFITNNDWTWKDDEDRDGEFTTNSQGKGNFHGTILSEGVTWVQVVVREPYPPLEVRYSTRSIDVEEI